MPQLGVPELLIILVIIIAVFGAGKLANLGGALGKGVRDFRKNIRSDEDEAKPAEEAKAAEVKPVEQAIPAEEPKPASNSEAERAKDENASA
jgi:sec-independent protein translocase protein TatA